MGKVISFVSIKGGVGKTTLSASLAAELANNFGKKVLLIDGNYSAPNLGLHMDIIKPEKTIHQVLSGKAKLKEAVHFRHGVDVVPGDFFWRKHFNPLKLRDKLKYVKKDYDFIIIDSSPALNEEVLSAMLASDDIFIVTTPDYPTLSCTLRAAALAKQRGTQISGLIINKTSDSRYEISSDEIEEVTGIPVVGVLPYDKTNIAALFTRIPTSIYKRRCEFSKQLRKLGAAFSNEKEMRNLFGVLFGKLNKDEINRQVLRESFYKRVLG